jgi:hypothetical protein
LCIRLLGVDWSRSCIKGTFQIILNDLASNWKPLTNARRNCKIRYRSGGMEGTRLLGCYSLKLLEAYVMNVNLRLGGALK